ncbi:RNA-binding domain-containing protein [Trametes coccinea BRFM310]|uniref:RNA-binding domain-containing protein n=1 Tax=Trametes coccinea (strain BRFM310) TaxID=1353009 RepID=A0A1Y2IFH2_TRAC3|nr:RNA-binding domain-containing protein [Trametes coccinea BRFM310]
MSLNDFLGDSTLGSWADEMDMLPTAPAARTDEERARGGDRRRDDFLSSRPDRGPPREDLPLPTEPPFTAFVGNLTFDITESELEEFFGGKTKSVKIIKDREDKPKGFGYVEFNDLDGLKEALTKTGTPLAGRAVRVSVAEPPKERSGFGGGGAFEDDPKFAGNWRRDGPLPDLPGRGGDGPRRRFEGPRDGPGAREPPPPSVSDNISDWRSSSRAPARAPPSETEGGFRRRGPGSREPAPTGPADTEETWHIGSKFKPSGPPEGGERPGSRFGSLRSRGEMGPPRDVPPPAAGPADEGDWRRPRTISRNSTSPSSSTPPTPQMGRRKLELLPRSSSSTSATPSPLASPNPSTTTSRSNPFGAAKPVDVTARENEVLQKIEREREEVREKIAHTPMSRTSSRTGSQRGAPSATASAAQSPTAPTAQSPTTPQQESHKLPPANVRPSFSFASAAAGKKEAEAAAAAAAAAAKDDVTKITEKIEEVELESSEQ